MATASVTYSFTANTLIKSAEGNTNFSDLVGFLNTQVIHKDGTVAFTAIPSGPGIDPSGDNQFARKAYVDKLGIVAQQTLTANGASFSATTTTDMALNNVSVIAGRTYAVHVLSQYEHGSVVANAAWSITLLINGALYRRMWITRPQNTGTMEGTIDATVYWTPSVTAATDDLAVQAVENIDGSTFQLTAGATFPRTMTLIDLGVL